MMVVARLSPSLEVFLQVVGAGQYPSMDPPGMKEAGVAYRQLAEDIPGLRDYITSLVKWISDHFRGAAGSTFVASVAGLVALPDGSDPLTVAAGQVEGLAAYALQSAEQAEYTQLMVITVNAWVWAPFQPEVLFELAWDYIAAREFLGLLWKWFVEQIGRQAFSQLTSGLKLDVLVQGVEIAQGDQDGYSTANILSTLENAGINALLGPVLHIVGKGLGDVLASALGHSGGEVWAGDLDHVLTDAAHPDIRTTGHDALDGLDDTFGPGLAHDARQPDVEPGVESSLVEPGVERGRVAPVGGAGDALEHEALDPVDPVGAVVSEAAHQVAHEVAHEVKAVVAHEVKAVVEGEVVGVLGDRTVQEGVAAARAAGEQADRQHTGQQAGQHAGRQVGEGVAGELRVGEKGDGQRQVAVGVGVGVGVVSREEAVVLAGRWLDPAAQAAFTHDLGRLVEMTGVQLRTGFAREMDGLVREGAGSVAGAFQDGMQDLFRTHLGGLLGSREVAGGIGRDFGRALTRFWGRAGAHDAALWAELERALTGAGHPDLGEGLDAGVVESLAYVLPELIDHLGQGDAAFVMGVRVVEHAGMGLQNLLASGVIDAANGQGFSPDFMSFASGMAMGVMGQALHHFTSPLGHLYLERINTWRTSREHAPDQSKYYGATDPITYLAVLANLAGYEAPLPVPRNTPTGHPTQATHLLQPHTTRPTTTSDTDRPTTTAAAAAAQGDVTDKGLPRPSTAGTDTRTSSHAAIPDPIPEAHPTADHNLARIAAMPTERAQALLEKQTSLRAGDLIARASAIVHPYPRINDTLPPGTDTADAQRRQEALPKIAYLLHTAEQTGLNPQQANTQAHRLAHTLGITDRPTLPGRGPTNPRDQPPTTHPPTAGPSTHTGPAEPVQHIEAVLGAGAGPRTSAGDVRQATETDGDQSAAGARVPGQDEAPGPDLLGEGSSRPAPVIPRDHADAPPPIAPVAAPTRIPRRMTTVAVDAGRAGDGDHDAAAVRARLVTLGRALSPTGNDREAVDEVARRVLRMPVFRTVTQAQRDEIVELTSMVLRAGLSLDNKDIALLDLRSAQHLLEAVRPPTGGSAADAGARADERAPAERRTPLEELRRHVGPPGQGQEAYARLFGLARALTALNHPVTTTNLTTMRALAPLLRLGNAPQHGPQLQDLRQLAARILKRPPNDATARNLIEAAAVIADRPLLTEDSLRRAAESYLPPSQPSTPAAPRSRASSLAVPPAPTPEPGERAPQPEQPRPGSPVLTLQATGRRTESPAAAPVPEAATADSGPARSAAQRTDREPSPTAPTEPLPQPPDGIDAPAEEIQRALTPEPEAGPATAAPGGQPQLAGPRGTPTHPTAAPLPVDDWATAFRGDTTSGAHLPANAEIPQAVEAPQARPTHEVAASSDPKDAPEEQHEPAAAPPVTQSRSTESEIQHTEQSIDNGGPAGAESVLTGEELQGAVGRFLAEGGAGGSAEELRVTVETGKRFMRALEAEIDHVEEIGDPDEAWSRLDSLHEELEMKLFVLQERLESGVHSVDLPDLHDPLAVRQWVVEIGAYLGAHGPRDSSDVWRGADGRERLGNAEAWRNWIQRGETYRVALEQARNRSEVEIRETLAGTGALVDRLTGELRKLKAELRLGEAGTLESTAPGASPRLPRPQTSDLAGQRRWASDVLDNMVIRMAMMWVRVDVTGDALGDVAGGNGAAGFWLRAQREIRRIAATVKRLKGANVAPDDAARAVEQVAARAEYVAKLLDDNKEALEFLRSHEGSPWTVAEDAEFSQSLARFDLPRSVTSVMPKDAVVSAMQPFDVNEIRLLPGSVAPDGLMWRNDRNPLYRADERSPEEIRQAGGFLPWEANAQGSLVEYQRKAGQANVVSTTRSARMAAGWGASGGIYVIDAPGGIDLVATLRRYVMPDLQEVVFPGGIDWKRVRGWHRRANGELFEFVENPDYEALPVEPAPTHEVPVPEAAVPAADTPRPEVPQGPVVGVEGVRYPGPSRRLLSESVPQQGLLPPVVHRGEFEVEPVDGVPHVRLYTVLTKDQVPYVDAVTNEILADLGDVQQSPETGGITVVPGAMDRPLAVYVGRPLAALKVMTAAGKALGELFPWQREAASPLVRSFLVPLDAVEKLSGGAAAMESYPGQEAGNVVNIRPDLEPNLFTVPRSMLPALAEQAVPHSLITYTEDANALSRGAHAGDIQHPDVLRDRLGVPRTEMPTLGSKLDPWPTADELASGDFTRARAVARELRQHYATWQQSRQAAQDRVEHALLTGDHPGSYYGRKKALDAFLAQHAEGVNTLVPEHARDAGPAVSHEAREQAVDRFMGEVVRPWADQAAIAETIVTDHARMRVDLNVTGTITANDFAGLHASHTERTQHQAHVGRQIDELWEGGASPKEILDHLIGEFPELSRKYDEITVWDEHYSYYEHAQMVLGQYQKLTGGEEDPAHLLPVSVVVKAILFHDIEKDNAKRQHPEEQATRNFSHDAAPEHTLAVDTAKRYGALFGNELSLQAAVTLIDSDPFGFYMTGRIGADEAFAFVATWALKLGGHSEADPEHLSDAAVADVQRLFHEFHRYYQADFSSYTTDSSYTKDSRFLTSTDNGLRRGRRSFDQYFARGGDGGLKRAQNGRHFEYSDVDGYRQRFADLARRFDSPEHVRETYERTERERAGQKSWYSDWMLSDDPLAQVHRDYQPTSTDLRIARDLLNMSGPSLESATAFARDFLATRSQGDLPAHPRNPEAVGIQLHAVRVLATGWPRDLDQRLEGRDVNFSVLTSVAAAGLRLLPKHVGASYRPIAAAQAAALEPGTKLTRPHVQLASPRQLPSRSGALLVLHSASGHNVSDLVQGGGPVVFPPKTDFVVVWKEPAPALGPNGVLVHLREITEETASGPGEPRSSLTGSAPAELDPPG